MVDRLSEIKHNTNYGGGGGSVSYSGGSEEHMSLTSNAQGLTDVELGTTSQAAFMSDFFDEVSGIKSRMTVIRRNIKIIEQKHASALTAISLDVVKQNNDELERLMDETQSNSTHIRNALKKMANDNAEFCRANESHSSEARIRTNMHGTLTRKFVDMMAQYQEVQTRYKAKYKERCSRQIRIVNPNATQEDVERVLEGNPGRIFADVILSPSQTAAKNALADIQEKHRDILKLESSIAELHQLFLDMSILVETQGELLDQIEYSVQQSVAYTEKGVTELVKAKEYSQKARKKMCFIVICLIIVIAIVLLPVLNAMGVFKSA